MGRWATWVVYFGMLLLVLAMQVEARRGKTRTKADGDSA